MPPRSKSPAKPRAKSPTKNRSTSPTRLTLKPELVTAFEKSSVPGLPQNRVPDSYSGLSNFVWKFIDKTKIAGQNRTIPLDAWLDEDVRKALEIDGPIPIFEKGGLQSKISQSRVPK